MTPMEILGIANPFPGGRSYFRGSLDSTQEEAKRLARRWEAEGGEPAFPPGSLVAADEQTAGRGRVPGRRWTDSPGKSLLFTLRLPAGAAELQALPLRIGAAVCSAAAALASSMGASFERPPRLKWPNDLMIGDSKACGVLCEAGRLGVFAGIGVNCNQSAFAGELEGRATSLALALGRDIDRLALLELILSEARERLEDRSWPESVRRLLWRMGEEVTFVPGPAPEAGGAPGAVRARVAGVDERGALLLESADGRVEAYLSGELLARPVPSEAS
jgi:BirA family transcriptional regulator, biotin operon repressor / biotin---[acetyl-CoA-carboxylase] ligase